MLKLVIPVVLSAAALAQTTPAAKPPASAAAKPAAPKPSAAAPNVVDSVIELKNAGMKDEDIIKALQRENKPHEATMAETLKLSKAGVSQAVIDAIGNPKAAAVASAGAPPAPAPVAPSNGASRSAPATAPTGAATPFPPDLPNTPAVRKRRLAVKPFDYSTVRTWVNYWFHTDYNIGDGIRAMLVTRMHQSKNITLLERTNIADVMKEQDFGGTDRVRQGTRAKKGNISGADCILYGDIVIFGHDDTTKHSRLPALIPGIGTRVAAATMSREEKAVVGINLRLVDAETGEVLETAESRGESSRKSKDYAGALGIPGAGAAAGNTGMTSSNFEQTIIGEATSDAVNKVVAFLETKVPSLPAKDRTIEARVANINGSEVYLSIGDAEGVLPGDRFEILQINEELRDPATKEVIDVVAVKVGEVVVSTVRDKSSIGTYGGAPITQAYAVQQSKGYAARLMSK